MSRSDVPTRPTTGFRIYSRTDVGKRRQRNEDSLGVVARHGLFVVADGMGGADGGDYSSRRVVDDLVDTFRACDREPSEFQETLDRVCESVNRSSAGIREEARAREISGMGTTVVALCFDPEDERRACALHVGDSRVYRFRNRKLARLTRDHSLAAESGIRDSDAIPMFMAGVITRAVGVKEEVEVDRTPIEVQPGDLYMLCSDGLYNMVSESRMEGLLGIEPPDPAAELVQAANEAGGFDNITVVLVKIPGAPYALDDTVS